MEKVEKLFDSVWGLVLFYIIVALVSLLICKGINNSVASNNVVEDVNRTYYA